MKPRPKVDTKGFGSKSRAGTFSFCKANYRFQYIDKVEVKTPEYMSFGVDFHDWAENFYEEFKKRLEKATIKDPINELSSWYNDLLFDDPDEYEHEMNFIDFNYRRAKNILAEKPEEFDKYFYPVGQELYLYNKEKKWHGYADILFLDTDDELMVFELKTGKVMQKSKIVQELAIYKVLIDESKDLKISELTNGREIKKWGVFYSGHNESDNGTFHTRQVESAKKYMKNFLVAIEDEKDFMPITVTNPFFASRWCHKCQYHEHCVRFHMDKNIVKLPEALARKQNG
jgi:hypothetical protein